LGRDARVNVPLIGCGTLVCRHRESHPFAVVRGRGKLALDAVPIVALVCDSLY
jgi:hypothetical protein